MLIQSWSMKVSSCSFWTVAVILTIGSQALPMVRTITVDEAMMAEIHLAMGRSTVLHFFEKPAKVVAGNQNYFNIEFTGNDITVQPLGPVTSNLFAYGEYHRYGFILRVSISHDRRSFCRQGRQVQSSPRPSLRRTYQSDCRGSRDHQI